MNRPVRSNELASEELAEAVRWYEARLAGLGGELFDAVVAALALIETRPEIGTTVSADGQTRRVLVARFPYQVERSLTAAGPDGGRATNEDPQRTASGRRGSAAFR